MKEIVAARMWKHNWVGVATIVSHEQLLIQGKNMAENVTINFENQS